MSESKNPIIVELYGLPGCGKTTLRDNLTKESSGLSYVMMTELTQQYRKLPLHKKIQYIPWSSWRAVLRFLMIMPKLSLKDWRFYKTFFAFTLMYNFTKYAKRECYIVNDHGLLQALVSLMYGHSDGLTEKQCKHFFKILCMMPNCLFVYCHLSSEMSFRRIRGRNRNVGRLDLIKDDALLLDSLRSQEKLFDTLHRLMNACDGIYSFLINSETNQDECTEQLKHILS